MTKQLTHIDIFAGCGGLSLGLHNAGIQGVFAIEKQPAAFSTLKHNLIEKHAHFSWPDWLAVKSWDIREILDTYSAPIQKMQGEVDILVGGPPCQGFSSAGRRRSTDERNLLIHAYLDFVELVRPRVVLFENVRGFTLKFSTDQVHDNVAYSEIVLSRLDDLGYSDATGKMIDFSDYGVPQRRQRFLVIATQDRISSDIFSALENNRDQFLSARGLNGKKVSCQDALSDLEKQHGTTTCPDSPNFLSGITSAANTHFQRMLRLSEMDQYVPDSHRFVNHTPRLQQVFSELLMHAPRNKVIIGEARKRYGVKKRSLTVLDPNEPSPTVTTIPDDIVHYSEPRILTVREIARLQTFPDWFEFKGPYTTGTKNRTKSAPRYTQVGNAVPPLFAEQIGIAIKQVLSKT